MTKQQLETGINRRRNAAERRRQATDYSSTGPVLIQKDNLDESNYPSSHLASFTKGLKHDEFGITQASQYQEFCDALVEPSPTMNNLVIAANPNHRKWESPLGGHYFTLQGPDPDAVAMPPAPKLGLSELCAEMASVYAMALVRDVPFHKLDTASTKIPNLKMPDGNDVTVKDILDQLKKLSWFDKDQIPTGYFGTNLTMHEKRRRQAAWDENGELTLKTLFRGSTKGAKQGPYISQFMLIGTGEKPKDGKIAFGVQTVNQQQSTANAAEDFMTNWSDWLHVQQGANTKGLENPGPNRRISTPRDLATYVHFDALYQAYLNACLILLGAIGKPGGNVNFALANPVSQQRGGNSEGFATWGGPHILSLVTEVATRGLRAVRRQKFQVHRRARPEVIAARLAQVANGHTGEMEMEAVQKIESMLQELGSDDHSDSNRPGLLLHWVDQLNSSSASDLSSPTITNPVDGNGKNYLLPMAFSEGSPMHPAYGAGHATVAGACVTILKAFFETNVHFLGSLPNVDELYEAEENDNLKRYGQAANPTIADELDKLAANISIGRNMAGVHYFSDYYDSLRLGERVALGVLEEQMLTYDEPVTLTFQSFDNEEIMISTQGTGNAGDIKVMINGASIISRNDWWVKDIIEYGMVESESFPSAEV